MAYIFMMDDGGTDYDGTWKADSGENAVILQPATFECQVKTTALTMGPTLEKRIEATRSFWKKLNGRSPAVSFREVELAVGEVEINPHQEDAEIVSRIGGAPGWLQNDETPTGGWDLIIQIDSNNPNFELNFGDAGVGYAFIRRDGHRAIFLWQCC